MCAKSFVAGLVFVCSVLSATPVLAQDDAALLRDGLFARDQNIAVEERPKPEYEALPNRTGTLLVSPAITGRIEWNNNVFATNTAKASDEIARLEPSISVASDWPRNQISAFAHLDSALYFDHSGEDTTDYAVGATGRLDAQHDLGLAGGASVERYTEPRTSEASPLLSAHPVQYDVVSAWIEGTKEFDRFRLTARGSVDDFTYDNVSTLAGAQIYQKDQDHTALVGAFKAEYAYLPDVSFVAHLAFNDRDYRDELPGEISRTSTGYEAAIGANFDLTHLVRGEGAIGYLEQDYKNYSSFKTVRGLSFHGKIEYFPTQLTTITLLGSRDVENSGIINVDGYLESRISLQLDHELLRNLVLTGAVSYTGNHYQNYPRNDDISGLKLAARYLLNRAISLDFTYLQLRQSSVGADVGPNYDVERAMISLTCRI